MSILCRQLKMSTPNGRALDLVLHSDEAGPSIPEEEKYENLMKDVRSENTIFYVQGRAFVFAFSRNVLH